jgi:hypothetical protein
MRLAGFLRRTTGALVTILLVCAASGPHDNSVAAQIPVPGPFSKTAPPNGSNLVAPLILQWTASANAASYEYCIDTSNNNFCNSSWISVGNNTSVQVLFIAGDNRYWQVRARNGNNLTEASGGWWTLRNVSPPPDFAKTAPLDGADNQPSSVRLRWMPSVGTQYQYCLDAMLNNACDVGWRIADSTLNSALVESLSAGVQYEWQVRVLNAFGITEADGGRWFRFATRALPPGTYFLDDLETGDGVAWDREGGWAVSTEAVHSGNRAWSDSPGFVYDPDSNSSIYSPPIDLRSARHPQLTFWHIREFADDVDGGFVWISTDSLNTFTQLRAYLGTDQTWRQDTIDLTPYAGAAGVQIVFQLWSDDTQEADGWHIDDILVAEAPRFTDDPLVAGVTTIRSVHVTELRAAVDALRLRSGLLPFRWMDSPAAGTTPIRAQHVAELRAALAEVYARIPRAAPSYTDPVLTPGITTVKAAHIQEIRAAIIAIE